MSRGGRRGGRAHLPVESCHSLSSWGHFQSAQMWESADVDDSFEWEFFEDRCELKFTRDGSEHSQTIALTWSPCRFGGRRSWFLCPWCGRRVGRVYLPCTMYVSGSGWRVTEFRCRSCYHLTYLQRQQRDLYWVLTHRAERLSRYFTYDEDEKMYYPLKWQRRETFDRRVNQYEEMLALADSHFLDRCKWLLKYVEKYRDKYGK